jgi:hypothetical protein
MQDSKIGKFAMWAAFIFALIVVCGLWRYSVPIHDFFFGTSEDQTESFESMTTLFSGLAFVILIFTLWMQSRELEMQRQELADTREELAGTRKAQEAMVEKAHFSAVISAHATLGTNLASGTNGDLHRKKAQKILKEMDSELGSIDDVSKFDQPENQ